MNSGRPTRLSLSLGGSCGSVADRLGGGGGGGLGAFGFSGAGAASALGFRFSSTFSAGGGGGAAFSPALSDGATCVAPSPDLEITAILVPGSTVSPSLATNYNSSGKQTKLRNKNMKDSQNI